MISPRAGLTRLRRWQLGLVLLILVAACGGGPPDGAVSTSSTPASGQTTLTTTTVATTTTFDVDGLKTDARAVCEGSQPGLTGASYADDGSDTLYWIGMDDDARALIRNSDVDGVPALLGCVSSTRLEEVVEECAYEGGYTVLHYATDWTVRLIRADDGAEVHTAAFSQRRADCSQFLNIDNDPPKTRERSSLDNLQLRVVAEAVPHALDAEFYCSQLSAREATDLSQYATMPKVSIHYKGGYSDHDPEFTLPAEMAPTPEEPADVALCLGEVKLGRDDELRGYMAVGAYHADGTKLGSWQYEENGHDPSGPGPLPAPGPDWFLDNLGPILGYPAD